MKILYDIWCLYSFKVFLIHHFSVFNVQLYHCCARVIQVIFQSFSLPFFILPFPCSFHHDLPSQPVYFLRSCYLSFYLTRFHSWLGIKVNICPQILLVVTMFSDFAHENCSDWPLWKILGEAAAESLSIWHKRQYWNINACTAHDTALWWLLEKADPLLDVFIKFPSKENAYRRMIKLNNDGKGHFSSLLSYINKTFLIHFGILWFLKLRKEYRTKSLPLKVLYIF